jgi:hypothetical protein
VPLPVDVVAELARYLESRGLDLDPEDISNQGAYLLGKAVDAAQRAPGLSNGQAIDPRQGIAATTFYDQIKAFFAECAGVLRGKGDAKGPNVLHRASTHWMRHSHASHAIASLGCRSRSRSRTWGMHRWPPRPFTSRPKSARRMKAVEAFWKYQPWPRNFDAHWSNITSQCCCYIRSHGA